MMSWPPTRKDHEAFYEVEQWQGVRDARGPARRCSRAAEGCSAGRPHVPVALKVGLGESEVASMSKDEANARLQSYWTDGV